MTNANDCAYPADNQTQTEGGLTKREYFAGLAMQGILANAWKQYSMIEDECGNLAKAAINFADALINELNKQP